MTRNLHPDPGTGRLGILLIDHHEVSRAAPRAVPSTERVNLVDDVGDEVAMGETIHLVGGGAIVEVGRGDRIGVTRVRALRTRFCAAVPALTSGGDRSRFTDELAGRIPTTVDDLRRARRRRRARVYSRRRGSARTRSSQTWGSD